MHAILRTCLFVLLVLLVRGVGVAAAEEPKGVDAEKSPPAPSFFAHHAKSLDIEAEQLTRLERVTVESSEYAAVLNAELHAAQADLKRLLEATNPEFALVMAQADRVGSIETRLKKHQLATLLSLRAILSPGQRDKLTTLIEARTRRPQSTAPLSRRP